MQEAGSGAQGGKKRRIWIGAGILLVAALAVAAWMAREAAVRNSGLELPGGETLEAAQLEELSRLPEFTLDRAGGTLTAADLRNRWAFVFFGYTNCPNSCPATLAMLNHVQESLRSQGMDPPRIVFVSLDARRDTPALLGRYTASFGPDAIGATGSDEALHGLLAFFGVNFERIGPLDTNYTIDHTTDFFLVTPDGRWLATFPPSEDGDAVAKDTGTLLRFPLR